MPPPPPSQWRYILKVPSHLRQSLLRGLFPSGLPTKSLYGTCRSSVRATCPVYFMILGWSLEHIWWEVQIIKLLIMWSSPHPCYLVPLRPKYLPLSTLLASSSACLPLIVRDQVSHPYKPACETSDLYIFLKGNVCWTDFKGDMIPSDSQAVCYAVLEGIWPWRCNSRNAVAQRRIVTYLKEVPQATGYRLEFGTSSKWTPRSFILFHTP
jgi:hypothetical protein